MSALLDLSPALSPDVADAICLLKLHGANMLVTRMVIDVDHPHGHYGGPRIPATVELVAEHLRGDVLPLGIVCGNGTFRDANGCKRHGPDRVHMLGADLDENAGARMRILAEILIARGCDERSLVATGGSGPGRGKIATFFARTQQGAALRAFGNNVLAEARRHAAWGPEPADKVTVELRPEEGEGGILRFGGRHVGRDGPLERFFHPLSGEMLALARVVPSYLTLKRLRTTIPVARRHRRIDKMLENGIAWTAAGTAGVRKTLNRLANEAYRTAGADAGETLFLDWVKTVKAKSPSLNAPSPKNRDTRHPLAIANAKSVWAHVAQKRGSGVTLNSLPTGDASQGLFNVTHPIVKTLETFVSREGLNPACFAITYERLTDALGLDIEFKMQTWREVKRLAGSGAIVILDPGIPRGLGDSAATLYSLPHLSPKAAAKAKAHPTYLKRLEQRAEHEQRQAAKALGKLTLIRPDVRR